MKLKSLPLYLLLALSLFSCRKEQQGVPYTYVNLIVYINDPQNSALTNIGGWKYFSGGYGGILVFRKTMNEFMVYDRACPVNPDDASGRITVDSSNILAGDAVCGSKFLLSDGSPVSGQAVVPLQSYRALFDGTVLRITNQ